MVVAKICVIVVYNMVRLPPPQIGFMTHFLKLKELFLAIRIKGQPKTVKIIDLQMYFG